MRAIFSTQFARKRSFTYKNAAVKSSPDSAMVKLAIYFGWGHAAHNGFVLELRQYYHRTALSKLAKWCFAPEDVREPDQPELWR